MRSNYKTLDSFIDFALKYGFSGIHFLNMVGGACPEENIFSPLDTEALNYLKSTFPLIIEKAKHYGINISHELSPFLEEANCSSDACGDMGEHHKTDRLFCSMPWRSLFIDGSQNGNIYPECLCRKPIGNIFSNSLDEVWNNNEMQEYRKRIVNRNIENWCNSNCVNGLVSKDFLQGL